MSHPLHRTLTYPGALTSITLCKSDTDTQLVSVKSAMFGATKECAPESRLRYEGVLCFIESLVDAGMSDVLEDPRFEETLMNVAFNQGQEANE